MNAASSPIRAVLFDVDGTLYHARPLRLRMALSLLLLPLRGPFRARRTMKQLQAFRRALEEVREEEHGEAVIADVHLRRAAEKAGADIAEVRAAVDEWMMRRPLDVLARYKREGLDELMGALRKEGLRVGFLSDYPVGQKIAALGLGTDDVLCLCASDAEINAYKPKPQGYLRACEAWDLPPEEVLYVGDRPEVDAVGAAAVGMRCAIIGRDRRSSADSGVDFIPVASFGELAELLTKGP